MWWKGKGEGRRRGGGDGEGVRTRRFGGGDGGGRGGDGEKAIGRLGRGRGEERKSNTTDHKEVLCFSAQVKPLETSIKTLVPDCSWLSTHCTSYREQGFG